MNKSDAVKALRATGSSLVDEYINEAEHQDGIGYWQQFSSMQDAVDDFRLYRENVEKKEAPINYKTRALPRHVKRVARTIFETLEKSIEFNVMNDKVIHIVVQNACRQIIGRPAPLHDDDAEYYSLHDELTQRATSLLKRIVRDETSYP